LERAPNWAAFLAGGLTSDEGDTIRRHARTGRPAGDDAFLAGLEAALGRPLRKRKPGRKRKTAE
jgi:putative transposase